MTDDGSWGDIAFELWMDDYGEWTFDTDCTFRRRLGVRPLRVSLVAVALARTTYAHALLAFLK